MAYVRPWIGPRNWLFGKSGDQINAIAMAIGFNLRKILGRILLCLIQAIMLRRTIRDLQTYSA